MSLIVIGSGKGPELLAMQVFALGRSRHRRTQKFEPPLLQDWPSKSKKISAATEENPTK
jgi:hypothetical protein